MATRRSHTGCSSDYVSASSSTMVTWLPSARGAQTPPATPAHTGPLFQSATHCMACHDGLTTPSGEDVSFGTSWRASMMAHSALDPYWQAGVRREVMDHPVAQTAIENECSRCHMPMAQVQAQAGGRRLSVFANSHRAALRPMPWPSRGSPARCAIRLRREKLGEKASFSGGFAVDMGTPPGERPVFGPYKWTRAVSPSCIRHSGFRPAKATHIQQSEVCATCHTLYTHPLDAAGQSIGEFPEQVPYQEWLQSAFRDTHSCQSCHMPMVEEPTPITSVLRQPREGLSRHDFRGGNFFMLGLLNRFRQELGVVARPAELTRGGDSHEGVSAGECSHARRQRAWSSAGDRLEAHDPGAQSERPQTADGLSIEAGVALRDPCATVGNDLCSRRAACRHRRDCGQRQRPRRLVVRAALQQISSPDQVQIYEAIMGTQAGR